MPMYNVCGLMDVRLYVTTEDPRLALDHWYRVMKDLGPSQILQDAMDALSKDLSSEMGEDVTIGLWPQSATPEHWVQVPETVVVVDADSEKPVLRVTNNKLA